MNSSWTGQTGTIGFRDGSEDRIWTLTSGILGSISIFPNWTCRSIGGQPLAGNPRIPNPERVEFKFGICGRPGVRYLIWKSRSAPVLRFIGFLPPWPFLLGWGFNRQGNCCRRFGRPTFPPGGGDPERSGPLGSPPGARDRGNIGKGIWETLP